MRPLKPDPYDKNGNRKAIGERSEALITARLVEIGYNVLKPYGDNLRYDLLIEDASEHFWRVQCKTGRIRPNEVSIHFSAVSSYAHTRAGKGGNPHKDYQGQIDYFAIYCPETQGVYLIPIDHVHGDRVRLYLCHQKGKQMDEVKWAKDYEL